MKPAASRRQLSFRGADVESISRAGATKVRPWWPESPTPWVWDVEDHAYGRDFGPACPVDE